MRWKRQIHEKGQANLADIYLLKVNNKNTRTRCEICSKLIIKTPCSSVSIATFEQANAGW